MRFRLIKYFFSLIIMPALIGISCSRNEAPKPRGYFRIAFPEKEYKMATVPCPFAFEYPKYCLLRPDSSQGAEPCWYDLYFAPFDAVVHLSYKSVAGNLTKYTEDARTLVYKHTLKAQAISEKVVNLPDKDVFGVIYTIEGNTASAYQFYLTDSSRHFIRGALYFSTRTQIDSLRPVIRFIAPDIDHFVSTFTWK